MCTQSVAIVMSTDTPEPEPLPEPDYLMPKSKLLEQKLEIIPGEKKGSEWLIINDEFISKSEKINFILEQNVFYKSCSK